MNPSMIMSYLSDIDCNSKVEISIVRQKYHDQIEITTDEFSFVIDEFGSHCICINGYRSDVRQDSDIWKLVRKWVKDYCKIIL